MTMSKDRKAKKAAKKAAHKAAKKAAKKAAQKKSHVDKPRSAHKAATSHAPAKPAVKASASRASAPSTPAVRSKAEAVAGSRAPAGAPGKGDQQKSAAPPTKKPSRKSGGGRREGKSYAPGDLLLPGGCLSMEEIHYFLRGCVAAEHRVAEEGLQDVLAKRGPAESEITADDVKKLLVGVVERFASGAIEPMLPSRAQARRTFAGFVERTRSRRREIGAFLRGLDLGRTEVSHLDSHSETSLQNLMEWTARIEKMVEEGEEPEHADYNQLHRGIDQLDNTTEALIVDLETTLRRLRDRAQQ
jgi:hypothetical protein